MTVKTVVKTYQASAVFRRISQIQQDRREIQKKQDFKERWRQIGKSIMIISTAASKFQKLEATRRQIQEQEEQIRHFLANRKDYKLCRNMFDVSLYKRQENCFFFSREIEELCSTQSIRSRHQIRTLRLTLRDCLSFGAYPDTVQNEMCRLGIIERYGPGRVLIREGHIAWRVYFILSGTVVLTRFNKDTREEETVQILKKGDIFGDKEVLEQTRRLTTATIVTDITLWSVDGDDFKGAMAMSIKPKRIPMLLTSKNKSIVSRASLPKLRSISVSSEHSPVNRQIKIRSAQTAIFEFLQSLVWFEDVDMEKLAAKPNSVTLVYYRSNKTIVQSSTVNEHLYFVRGGKCDVITRIDDVIKPSSTLPPIQSAHPQLTTRLTLPSLTLPGKPERGYRGFTGLPKRGVLLELSSSGRSTTGLTPLSPRTNTGLPPLSPRTNSGLSSSSTRSAPGLTVNIPPAAVQHPQKTSQFLYLRNLSCGEVFGITPLFDNNNLEMSLVSRGCECIIVHRDLYSLLLNKQSKERLRNLILFYPSEEEIRRKLRNFCGWTKYKESLKYHHVH